MYQFINSIVTFDQIIDRATTSWNNHFTVLQYRVKIQTIVGQQQTRIGLVRHEISF